MSYSEASGKSFRSSVLVDVGRPVEITDQMLDTYMNGNADEKSEVLMQITNRLETHLRHITIAVPDWRDELWNLCKRENLVKHDVSDPNEPRNLDFQEVMIYGGRKMKSTIEISGKIFQSDTFSVPKIRGKRKIGRGLLVRSIRALNLNQLSFSCLNYVTQIRRIPLASLTHTRIHGSGTHTHTHSHTQSQQ